MSRSGVWLRSHGDQTCPGNLHEQSTATLLLRQGRGEEIVNQESEFDMRKLLSLGVLLLAISFIPSSTGATGSESAGLICTLAGKKIDACCCQLKDGRLYCPLAKTYIDSCCCKAAD